jgi:chromate transporter
MPKNKQNYIWRLQEIFLVSLYLGLTSFGGPVAHLGYFHTEYVKNRKWITEEIYSDLVALCQFLPGPASSQVGIAIGTYKGGILGGFLAWLGFTVPSVLILVFAFYGLREIDPARLVWIQGLKIVAVAIVAQAVWSMSTKLTPDKERATIALLGAVITLLWPNAYMQILTITVAGFAGTVFGRHRVTSQHPNMVFPLRKRTGAIALFLFIGLLIGLPLLRQITTNEWVGVFDSFYRIGSLVFGGGHVVLPMLEKEVVPIGWVEQSQFLTGYGLTQAVPGPLFTFASYLGAVMGGWSGAIITTIAIFLPSFLLVIGVVPFWDTLRTKSCLQSALWAVNAAVVGILLAALYDPVWTSAIRSTADFTIAIICFGLLQFWRVPPWCVVIVACLLAA